MRSKRIPAEEQYRLIMECRQSGLTDHQWCVEHDIKPGTFYNWVKRGVLATTAEGKVDVFEYLQNPEQLAKYELLSNCIACGVCEGACPVYAGGDAFIGPASLIWASRFVNDSRDTKAMERMDAIDTADGVAACQSVRACSRHCPRGIDVGEEMWQIVAKVRER